MSQDDVDYAVPAAVPRSRRRERADDAPADGLWGGRPRTWLKVGCWGLAVALLLVLLLPLVTVDETGSDSPEAAVAQLVQGIADTDVVAIIGAVDPVETRDPDRADAAYDRLSTRLFRRGEVAPPDVTAVLVAAERQISGSPDLTAVATVAALELELDGLELRTRPDPGGASSRAQVLIVDGELDVVLDPARLPDAVEGMEKAAYSVPLDEGWRRDGAVLVQPFLVTVERDGRWYVSLEASADALLPELG
ncbi:hypothetical protein [Nocardioides sp.]|uniref:hypothetical protein n=1 Tax=Nocardioides sp. TaxID=35761 RepID=UPI00271F12D0|nr:hypothetical protein [Nocardioides sp.]MDO9457232.1 hypothetical protein [Nocardioides sp.]